MAASQLEVQGPPRELHQIPVFTSAESVRFLSPHFSTQEICPCSCPTNAARPPTRLGAHLQCIILLYDTPKYEIKNHSGRLIPEQVISRLTELPRKAHMHCSISRLPVSWRYHNLHHAAPKAVLNYATTAEAEWEAPLLITQGQPAISAMPRSAAGKRQCLLCQGASLQASHTLHTASSLIIAIRADT